LLGLIHFAANFTIPSNLVNDPHIYHFQSTIIAAGLHVSDFQHTTYE